MVEDAPTLAMPAQFYRGALEAWYASSRTDQNNFFQTLIVPFVGGPLYGSFDESRELSVHIELIGDFSESIVAMVDDAEMFIWNSGVVAHAQKLEDMQTSPLYDKSGFGGFGYTADPHSHLVDTRIDGVTTGNVAKEVGDWIHGSVPVDHTHDYLFGAVSIPKVRPVLLCQKL